MCIKKRCYPGLKGGWLWRALLACFFANGLPAASIRELLAEFETGTTSPAFCAGDLKIGRSKEVSRFQILPQVWQQYTTSQDYVNPTTAWSVAERILRDRRETFRRCTGREWNDRELYLMWNAPGAYAQANFNPKKLSRVVRERAERFANLASRDRANAVKSPSRFDSQAMRPTKPAQPFVLVQK